MKDFFKKVIEGVGITPPEVCSDAFSKEFKTASHVEWFDHGDHFEAVFYKDNSEHIAMFDPEGKLVEYKMYLPDGYLPELIKSHLESRGEIMNVVLRNKGNQIEYEAIFRDTALNRYLVVFSSLGQVIAERPL
jgi:hypothetical protein